MMSSKLQLLAASFAIVAGLVGSAFFEGRAEDAKPADKARPTAKLDLTPETFADLHALIRPHADEWRHLKVEWLTDVVAARKKAAKEDKPIIICYTGGAGYNEPLGTC